MCLKNKDKINFYREQCISLFDIDLGVKTIDDFCKKIDLFCKSETNRLTLEKYSQHYIDDYINVLKGDLFEIFAEIFFLAFENDPEVGIKNYQIASLVDDYGVDAIGKNVNGDDAVIQMKYRSNPMELIDYDSLGKTYSSGKLQHNIPLEKNDTIFLFTTGNGATDPCKKVFRKKLRIINRKIIEGKVDNNKSFWDFAEKKIGETFQKIDE